MKMIGQQHDRIAAKRSCSAYQGTGPAQAGNTRDQTRCTAIRPSEGEEIPPTKAFDAATGGHSVIWANDRQGWVKSPILSGHRSPNLGSGPETVTKSLIAPVTP
jgi:hypothetical protein